MTVDAIFWGIALLWGAGLGLLYFGGLWLTLKMVLARRRSKQWLAASFALRLAVILCGFWVVLRTDLTTFCFTVAGFFVVRSVLLRVLGRESGGRYHAAHS